jgi:hypothetical protein
MHTIHERLIVMMEDPLIHTNEQPVCSDPGCPCHQDMQEAWHGSQAIPSSLEQHTRACASETEKREP